MIQTMLTIEELASALRVSTRQVQRLQADVGPIEAPAAPTEKGG